MNTCAFCERPENEVEHLVPNKAGSTHVCTRCLSKLITEGVFAEKDEKAPPKEVALPRPTEMKALLDQHIVAQERAKREVAVAVYSHYRRREAQLKGAPLPADLAGVVPEKSNILMMGPSGTGKTLIARVLADLLEVPFHIVDASKLTQVGYVGDDVENIIQGLIQAASGDLKAASWGIVFLDEVDKLARKSGRGASGYRDVTGEGVQQALLKVVEGCLCKDAPGISAKHALDTTNILFIAAGSFAGIEDIVGRRVNSAVKVGFGGASRKTVDQTAIYEKADLEDLLDFGLIPEFLGRFPIRTSTLPLTLTEMRAILTEPKNSLTRQMQVLYRYDGIDLVFEPSALDRIAELASKHPTGARALRTIVEGTLRDTGYERLGDRDVERITVTAPSVEGAEPPTVELKPKLLQAVG